MSTLPGTAIKLTFIETPVGGHPPLFYQNGSSAGTMASVNAGNSDDLYVGGGGINGGFAIALARLRLGAFELRTGLVAAEVWASAGRPRPPTACREH